MSEGGVRDIGVPDGITPVVGWRAWSVTGDQITSMNGTPWLPKAPLRAACPQQIPNNYPEWERAYRGALMSPSYYGNGGMPPEPSEALWRQHRARWFASHGLSVSLPEMDPDTFEQYVAFGRKSRLVVVGTPTYPEVSAPSARCSCGIYAVKAAREATHYSDQSTAGVLGRVALWGNVVVHGEGWRGEYAYPQAFFVRDKTLHKTLERYEVPILSRDQVPTDADSPAPAASRSVFNRVLSSPW